MKIYGRHYFFAAVALAVAALLWHHTRPADYHSPLNLSALGNIPVQSGGRIMPVDSVARTNLVLIAGKDHYTVEQTVDGKTKKLRREALNWLADLWFDPAQAAEAPIFRIDHPDIKGLLGSSDPARKYFSLLDIAPHFATLSEQFQLIDPEPHARDAYQRALAKLQVAISRYEGLAGAVITPPLPSPLEQEVRGDWAIYDFLNILGKTAREGPSNPDMAGQMADLRETLKAYYQAQGDKLVGIVPPGAEVEGDRSMLHWNTLPETMMAALDGTRIPGYIRQWSVLGKAYRNGSLEQFDSQVRIVNLQYSDVLGNKADKAGFEFYLNQLNPFLFSEILYLLALIFACLSWAFVPKALRPAAYMLMILAFLMHTFGLGARMWIHERPMVTSLYSSAVFIGWFVILLCWIIEDKWRYAFATAAGSAIGYSTLVIASHLLKQEGDTMGPMRAVLDSNFWLATHVPTVTIGYAATFLAGFLGLIYLVLARIPDGLKPESEKVLRNLVYGTTCFALLFSFVGTVLGGVWADQSWGRFWGWDPKENGALMIVLWTAAMLHVRWGRLVGPTGFMQMALVGNIITAWSWFGTNMLGIGLHSYGFMDAAFQSLVAFIASQMLLIVLSAFIPPRPGLPERL